ncbi:MAG: hypothetical protein KXJ53_04595 [Phenylobacterium sp.]|nr:hypothetical protein [Phenylobacterium sp.]
MKHILLVLAGASLLSGCAAAGVARVDGAGSPVQSIRALQTVDLPSALNPAGLDARNSAVKSCIEAGAQEMNDKCKTLSVKSPQFGRLSRLLGFDSTTEITGRGDKVALERLRLEAAFDRFYDSGNTTYGSREERRNRILHRLIAASDTNCGIFAENLYGVQATANFGLGSLATVLGGAGAIVSGVDAARTLSGLSSMASGVRAEANEDFFRQQWVEALTKAISSERDRLRTEMQSNAKASISAYPVEAAVADAIRYNNACSLVAGLQKVNEAVIIADDPAGLRAFRNSYSRAGFDASFNVSAAVRRDDGSSDRTLADASGSYESVSSELARLRVHIAEGKTEATIPEDKRVEAAAEIDGAFKKLYSTEQGANALLTSHLAQLKAHRDRHSTLSDELGLADNQQQRDAKIAEMRANAAAAEVIAMSALQMISHTEQQVSAILAKHKKDPASAKTP